MMKMLLTTDSSMTFRGLVIYGSKLTDGTDRFTELLDGIGMAA